MTSQPILEPILFRLVLSPGQLDWAWLKWELWILILGSQNAQIEKIIFGTFIYALWSFQNRKHPVGHIDTVTVQCKSERIKPNFFEDSYTTKNQKSWMKHMLKMKVNNDSERIKLK